MKLKKKIGILKLNIKYIYSLILQRINNAKGHTSKSKDHLSENAELRMQRCLFTTILWDIEREEGRQWGWVIWKWGGETHRSSGGAERKDAEDTAHEKKHVHETKKMQVFCLKHWSSWWNPSSTCSSTMTLRWTSGGRFGHCSPIL